MNDSLARDRPVGDRARPGEPDRAPPGSPARRSMTAADALPALDGPYGGSERERPRSGQTCSARSVYRHPVPAPRGHTRITQIETRTDDKAGWTYPRRPAPGKAGYGGRVRANRPALPDCTGIAARQRQERERG